MPDCTRCVHDKGLAKELGCLDKPSPIVLYTATCSMHGAACPKPEPDAPMSEHLAPRCKDGQRQFYRCPRKLTEGRADLHAALRAFIHYAEFGALPARGGLMDQTASAVAAFDVFRSEKVACHNERVEREEAERKRKEAVQQRGKGPRGGRRRG